MSTSSPPPWNVGSGFIFVRFFCERSSSRSAVSTSSDIVRPCRTASRLRSAMTASSILSVVFIWETISQIWLYGNLSISRNRNPDRVALHRAELNGEWFRAQIELHALADALAAGGAAERVGFHQVPALHDINPGRRRQ